MHNRDYLEEYFQLCKRIYEQQMRDGTWPWKADSTDYENVIDSEGNPHES